MEDRKKAIKSDVRRPINYVDPCRALDLMYEVPINRHVCLPAWLSLSIAGRSSSYYIHVPTFMKQNVLSKFKDTKMTLININKYS